mgnify:CR=1 FL=1
MKKSTDAEQVFLKLLLEFSVGDDTLINPIRNKPLPRVPKGGGIKQGSGAQIKVSTLIKSDF